jgi:hypothetical protein
MHFQFENDFVDTLRCIPMQVRFKLDACGIKLKLAEWSKLSFDERENLAELPCFTRQETQRYRQYLQDLIYTRTGNDATELDVEEHPAWANKEQIPEELSEKALAFDCEISNNQWSQLTDLQRFVLLKLCRPGHENMNFPKAIYEFGLGMKSVE